MANYKTFKSKNTCSNILILILKVTAHAYATIDNYKNIR